MVRRAWVLKGCVLLAVAGWMAWRIVAAWPVRWSPWAVPAAVTNTEFPSTRFLVRDIAAYASGARRDGELLRAFSFPELPPETCLRAEFVPPSGDATQFRRYGWPAGWLSYRIDATYHDVYDPASVRSSPAVLGSWRSGWNWLHRWKGASGRVVTREWQASGFLVGVIVVMGAWYGGRLLRGIARVTVGAHLAPRAARIVAALPLLAALLAACVVGVLSARARLGQDWLVPNPRGPQTRPIGLTIGDVRRLPAAPDGEARLALALGAGGETRPGADGVLVIGREAPPTMESSFSSVDWPVRLLTMSRVSPAREPVVWRLHKVTAEDTLLEINFTDAADASTTMRLILALRSVVQLVLGLWLAWAAPGVLIWIAGGWRVRRARRWARAGRCVCCGYGLCGLA